MVRRAALVLMVGTAVKIFFMDLWRPGQLYRVASFIGLASVLMKELNEMLVTLHRYHLLTAAEVEQKKKLIEKLQR